MVHFGFMVLPPVELLAWYSWVRWGRHALSGSLVPLVSELRQNSGAATCAAFEWEALYSKAEHVKCMYWLKHSRPPLPPPVGRHLADRLYHLFRSCGKTVVQRLVQHLSGKPYIGFRFWEFPKIRGTLFGGP